jgi:hypothetical protein
VLFMEIQLLIKYKENKETFMAAIHLCPIKLRISGLGYRNSSSFFFHILGWISIYGE